MRSRKARTIKTDLSHLGPLERRLLIWRVWLMGGDLQHSDLVPPGTAVIFDQEAMEEQLRVNLADYRPTWSWD